MRTIYLIAAFGLAMQTSAVSAAETKIKTPTDTEVPACNKPEAVLGPRAAGRNELVFTPEKFGFVESRRSLERAKLSLESCLKPLKRCLVTYDAKLGPPEKVAPLLSENIFAFDPEGDPEVDSKRDPKGDPKGDPKDRRPRDRKKREKLDLGTFEPNAQLNLAAPFPNHLNDQVELLSLNAIEAWTAAAPGSGVTTAVIDAGVDLKHPDLYGQLEAGVTIHCRTGQVCGGAADPLDSHGTRMAGIIAAEKDSKQGIVGVAWNTRLLPIRISTESVSTDYLAACAIFYAIEQANVKVINASWSSTDDLPLVHLALDAAVNLGKPQLIVAAAGNHFSNGDGNVDDIPAYPAVFTARNLLVVMAHDENKVIGSQSNWGPKSVDISAPGEALSIQNCGDTWVPGCLKYPPALATSTATAFVSGAAALLWSRYPKWTYEHIKWRLLANVHKEMTHTGINVAGGTLDLARVMLPLYLDYGDIKHYRAKPVIRYETAFPPGLCKSDPTVSVLVDGSVSSTAINSNPLTKIHELVVSAISPGQRVQAKAECVFDLAQPPISAESPTYVFQ